MTRAKEIEILMEDRCTKSEAEKLLKNGTIIYEDFEEVSSISKICCWI